MDYSNGSRLAKWQWDLANDPGVIIRVFEKDEDAELSSINVTQNLIVLRRYGLYNTTLITNKSSGILNAGSGFFSYKLKADVFLIYEKEGIFNNISFTKSSYYANAYNANMYQIKVSDFAVVNCLSESDRDVLYDFLINKVNNTLVFGKESLTLSDKMYNFQTIYSNIEKIETQMILSGKRVTATDRLILHIPLIQWQLGWHYASIFYYNWLTGSGDIKADDDLTSWLQSWTVFKQRMNEYENKFSDYLNKPLKTIPNSKYKIEYKAINSSLDFFVTNPVTNIYTLNDMKSRLQNVDIMKKDYEIEWDSDRQITNFSTTTIAANEDSNPISSWLAAFASTSFQHCFSGKVLKNDDKEAVIEITEMYFYVRDSFDFPEDEQPLGKWNDDIVSVSIPEIAPANYVISSENYITNRKLFDFKHKYNIGRDFDIYLKPISTKLFFTKIIYNKEKNEIIYQK
jgi:hypothetical protein